MGGLLLLFFWKTDPTPFSIVIAVVLIVTVQCAHPPSFCLGSWRPAGHNSSKKKFSKPPTTQGQSLEEECQLRVGRQNWKHADGPLRRGVLVWRVPAHHGETVLFMSSDILRDLSGNLIVPFPRASDDPISQRPFPSC